MQYKTALGLLSAVLALGAYWFYLKDIVAGKTRPNMFSWLIWGLLAVVAFFGQVKGKAGAGAWVTGITAAFNLLIFLLAIFKGEKSLHKVDKFLLGLAGLAIVLLLIVKDARVSVTLASATTLFAFYLTMKKSYYKPHQETVQTFALNSLKFLPSLFALQTFTYLTAVYPIVAMIANALLAVLIAYRSRIISA
jgi:hypothetical protein